MADDSIGIDPADSKGSWTGISTYTGNKDPITAADIREAMAAAPIRRNEMLFTARIQPMGNQFLHAEESSPILAGTPLSQLDNGLLIRWHPPMSFDAMVCFVARDQSNDGGLVSVIPAVYSRPSFANMYQNEPFIRFDRLRFSDVTGADDYLHGFYRKIDADGEIAEPLVPLFIAEALEEKGKMRHALAWQWIHRNQRRPRKREWFIRSPAPDYDPNYWEWSYYHRVYGGSPDAYNNIPIQVFGNLQRDNTLREIFIGRGHYRLLSEAYRDLVEACISTPNFEPLTAPLQPFQEDL